MDPATDAGGWKVEVASPGAQPACVPLPAAGVLADRARLQGRSWGVCGVGVAVAFRLAGDLDGTLGPPSLEAVRAAVGSLHPAIEVRATGGAPRSALVLGPAAALDPAALDLRTLLAYLAFDGQPVASARGAHATGDPWGLLAWLALHCGEPLRAGQVVSTGSCTGLLFAPEGARIDAHLQGLGRVTLQL